MATSFSVSRMAEELKEQKNKYEDKRAEYLQECERQQILPDSSLLEVKFAGNSTKSIKQAILSYVSEKESSTVKEIVRNVLIIHPDKNELSIRNEISNLKQAGGLISTGHGTYVKSPNF